MSINLIRRRQILASALALVFPLPWIVSSCSSTGIRFVIVGDSTAADYPSERAPLAGWGQMLKEALRDRADVINRAIPGRSATSYLHNDWQGTRFILREDDRLLIQFGHNDERSDSTGDARVLDGFRKALANLVAGARRVQARPLLLTPIPRYEYVNNHLIDTHGPFSEAVRDLSEDAGVPLLDLSRLGAQEMQKRGPAAARDWYMLSVDGHDNVHLTSDGAAAYARIVERELLQLRLL